MKPIPCDPLPRGVYTAPWVGPSGERYAIAISSDGRRIMEVCVYPGTDDGSAVSEMLHDVLDRVDPPPPPLSVVP